MLAEFPFWLLSTEKSELILSLAKRAVAKSTRLWRSRPAAALPPSAGPFGLAYEKDKSRLE